MDRLCTIDQPMTHFITIRDTMINTAAITHVSRCVVHDMAPSISIHLAGSHIKSVTFHFADEQALELAWRDLHERLIAQQW